MRLIGIEEHFIAPVVWDARDAISLGARRRGRLPRRRWRAAAAGLGEGAPGADG
jgi:hypothetical protein